MIQTRRTVHVASSVSIRIYVRRIVPPRSIEERLARTEVSPCLLCRQKPQISETGEILWLL